MNYYHPDTLEHIRNPLPAVAEWAIPTPLPVPNYNPQLQQCMFVSGAWLIEAVPVPDPVPIPTTVFMRQARLQLLALGSYSTVNSAISTMPEAAQIEWEYATDVQRENPLVPAMAQLLEWSDADTDLYFSEAAKL